MGEASIPFLKQAPPNHPQEQSRFQLTISLDQNPLEFNITATLTVQFDRRPTIDLEALVVFLTTQATRREIATVEIRNRLLEFVVELVDIQVEPGSSLLVIGLERSTRIESETQRGFIPFIDWAAPAGPLHVMQYADVNPTEHQISTEIKIIAQSQQQQNPAVRSMGFRAYLLSTAADGREQVREFMSEICVGRMKSSGDGLIEGRIVLSKVHLTGRHAPMRWEVVAYNDAFESDFEHSIRIDVTDAVLHDWVKWLATVVSVVAFVSCIGVALTSLTKKHSQSAPLAKPSPLAASPITVLITLQYVAMAGSMQLNSGNNIFWNMAHSVRWPLGQLGIVRIWDKLPSTENITLATSNRIVAYQHPTIFEIVVTAQAGCASALILDIVVCFAIVLAALAIVCIVGFRWIKPPKQVADQPKHRLRYKKQFQIWRRISHRLFSGAFCSSYYTVTVAALLVLRLESNVAAKVPMALPLILVTIYVPCLMLKSQPLSALWKRIIKSPRPENSLDIDANSKLTPRAFVMPVLGQFREGRECCAMACVLRMFLCAIAISTLLQHPVVQCCLVLAVFVIYALAVFRSMPYQGGFLSANALVDGVGQIIVITHCSISLAAEFDAISSSAQHAIAIALVVLYVAMLLSVIGCSVWWLAFAFVRAAPSPAPQDNNRFLHPNYNMNSSKRPQHHQQHKQQQQQQQQQHPLQQHNPRLPTLFSEAHDSIELARKFPTVMNFALPHQTEAMSSIHVVPNPEDLEQPVDGYKIVRNWYESNNKAFDTAPGSLVISESTGPLEADDDLMMSSLAKITQQANSQPPVPMVVVVDGEIREKAGRSVRIKDDRGGLPSSSVTKSAMFRKFHEWALARHDSIHRKKVKLDLMRGDKSSGESGGGCDDEHRPQAPADDDPAPCPPE
eukprot:c5147_g2_i1.p1 GENE.c5147_g2_i1~~c5147_g2_i1.p1  ORF type:complete len:971 (-),score=189.07 c5147_g2_i1:857-3568(-)